MRRGYTREAYLDLVRHVKELIPDVKLSGDMIAGFCGETEEDFQQTLFNEYVDFTTQVPKVPLNGIHIKIKEEPNNIFGMYSSKLSAIQYFIKPTIIYNST